MVNGTSGIAQGRWWMDRPDIASGPYGSVQDLLRAWARWSVADSGVHVGYPRQTAFRRLARRAGQATVALPPISDDLAARVDRAVAQLRLRSEGVPDDHRWGVLTDSYLSGWSDAMIGRRRKIGRNMVRTNRVAAENWIEGRVY